MHEGHYPIRELLDPLFTQSNVAKAPHVRRPSSIKTWAHLNAKSPGAFIND